MRSPSHKTRGRGQFIEEEHLSFEQRVAKQEIEISRTWKCTDKGCRNNKDYCFVDRSRSHYAFDEDDHAAWARDIVNKATSVQQPTEQIVNELHKRGACETSTKFPLYQQRNLDTRNALAAVPSIYAAASSITEIMQTSMVFDMRRRQTDAEDKRERERLAEERRDRERQELAEERRQQREDDRHRNEERRRREERSFLSPLAQANSVQLQQPYYLPPPPPPPLSYTPAPFTSPLHSLPTYNEQQPALRPTHGPAYGPVSEQPSSPVDVQEDPFDMERGFTEWLVNQSREGSASRTRVEAAAEAILREDWTLDQLRQMSDPESRFYRTATQAGLRDGILATLRSDARGLKSSTGYLRTWRHGQ